MIRVVRPAKAPAYLNKNGANDAAAVAALLLTDPAGYSTGLKTLTFGKSYGNAKVKAVVQLAQHDKCCYCEGKFKAFSAGDIDHYRPKAFVQSLKGSKKIFPGYYWLAYEWTNLLFVCPVCNRSYKKNLFPLTDESARSKGKADDLSAEEPLLLDPAGTDDPRGHIYFEGAFVRGRTKKGRETIKITGLDRGGLYDEREDALKNLRAMKDVCDAYRADPRPDIRRMAARAHKFLREALHAEAPFSSMARDFLNPR